MEQIIEIDFHGDKIVATIEGGKPLVAVKPICESLGLDWAAQFRSIKNDEVLSTCVVIKATQVGGQRRRMVFLPLAFFHGWLFKISPSKCRADRREKIVAYQRECYDVLHAYFWSGGAINPEASPMQLQILQARIEDYQKRFLPETPEGTASAINGRHRSLLTRSYYHSRPRKPSEMPAAHHPSLFERIDQ